MLRLLTGVVVDRMCNVESTEEHVGETHAGSGLNARSRHDRRPGDTCAREPVVFLFAPVWSANAVVFKSRFYRSSGRVRKGSPPLAATGSIEKSTLRLSTDLSVLCFSFLFSSVNSTLAERNRSRVQNHCNTRRVYPKRNKTVFFNI